MLIGLFFFVILFFYFYRYIKKDLNKFVYLFLISFFFFRFVFYKYAIEVAPYFGSFLNVILIILLWNILQNKPDEKFYKIFYTYLSIVLLTFFYIGVLLLLRENSKIESLYFIRNYFFNIVLFLLFITNDKIVSNKRNYFLKFLSILLLTQIILGVSQYYFAQVANYFKIDDYLWKGDIINTLGVNAKEQNVVIGTLERMGILGNTIAVMITFLSGYYLATKKINFNILFLIILSLILVGLTSIRTSFFTIILGLLLNLWFYKKKYFIAFFSISIIILVTYFTQIQYLGVIGIENSSNFENPIYRLFGIFYLLSDPTNITLGTITVARSLQLLPAFFDNPLFGVGLYFSKGYIGIDSISDAFLLFHIVEYGLIGFIILLLPYFYTLFLIKKKSIEAFKIMFSVFIVLVFQTITDNGIFMPLTNGLFFIFGGFVISIFSSKKDCLL